MPLPRAIYLDTNTLWGVAHRRDDPSLQTLGKYATDLGITLFTTGLVVDELVQKFKTELVTYRASLEGALDEFTGRRFVLPTLTWPEPFEQVVARMPEIVRGNLESYGLTVLPNQQVDQERLLGMAVRKELPFSPKGEEGEKGFRDAVILFTILAHAQANGWRRIMIITNDKAIVSSIELLPEAAALDEVQIERSINSAARRIDDFIDDFLRRSEEARKNACRIAILRERDRVQEFIRRRGVFPEGLFHGKLGFGESVTGVESASLTDVQVAAVGDLPAAVGEGRVQVSLDASIDVQVKVSRISLPPPRRFRLGGEGQESGELRDVGGILGLFGLGGETRTVSVEVRLEGSIHVRAIEQPPYAEFSDVQLDSFNPPSGIIAALLAGLTGPPPQLPPE